MCINWINAQKVDVRVELTKKKTSHCKSRDFLRKRRLKMRRRDNKMSVSRVPRLIQVRGRFEASN